MLIGELLVNLGLITGEQLRTALDLQAREGGRLGRVIADQGFCPQDRIDRAWADTVIVPALREAVARVLGGGAGVLEHALFRVAHLARRTLTEEDLLNGCEELETSLGIEGVAETSLDGSTWMPFQFLFLTESSTAYLDPESAQALLGWAASVERTRAGLRSAA